MKKGTYVLIILFVFFFLILAAVASFIYFEFGKPPAIKANSYLEIRLSGAILEKSAGDPFMTLFTGGSPLTMHDIWTNIRKAKADNRIKSLVLRLGYLHCEWAKISELRGMILDFQKSGKKAYAYIEETFDFDKEYYLATACDKIILHPLGSLMVNGIGGYIPFIKNALSKLGIEAEFEHVEEYKTAASMFIEDEFTPAHKEMMESIYGNIFSVYVKEIARSRKKSEEEIKSLIDYGYFQGEKAKEAGLVDDLLFEDELESLLLQDSKKIYRITHETYLKTKASSLGLNKGKKIALIYGIGPIHTGSSQYQSMGSHTIAQWIKRARRDKSIKAIVFRVDSPGGSAVASDVIWREVMLAKKEKPFIVSMSDLAGSGGYWVSMAGHKILAQPQSLTGSIGVLAGKFNMEKLYEKLGITSERLTYGKKADLFTTFRSLTPEERSFLKKEILWIYDQFLKKVAEGRNMTEEDVDKLGKGRVWTGIQAFEQGLVDEIGGLSRALELAKEMAGIPVDDEVKLVVWPKKVSFLSSLMGRRQAQLKLNLHPRLEKLVSTYQYLSNDRVWALMPLWIFSE